MKTLNLFGRANSGVIVDQLASFRISTEKMNLIRGGGGGERIEGDLRDFDIWYDDENP